jgi:hypothetical protein
MGFHQDQKPSTKMADGMKRRAISRSEGLLFD